jgi:1-acyl-sn-glycerol-3-phosphate acyltransferase
MAALEVLTALLFYLPFLLTIVFGLLALTIGILAIFSGTLLVLLLAAYGAYAVLRDTGTIGWFLTKWKTVWHYLSEDVTKNLQQTFVLENTESIPQETGLFVCHPHGLIGYSWMMHFCYGISQWPQGKPKPVVAIHSILFRIPFVRDVLEQFRCIEANEATIKSYLQTGTSVAILTGGIEEMRKNGESEVQLILKKRKGYARIAKECKVPLIPMFTVGENELFPNESWLPWKQVADLIYRWTKIQPPLPSWSSMKRWIQILQKPLDTPIQTFVLGTIDTKEKDEREIRAACIQLYTEFFKSKNIPADILS